VLAPLMDGKPGIYIHECCDHMVGELERLVGKEGKEDIADGQDDHAYDDLRYALTNYEDIQAKPPKPAQDDRRYVRGQQELYKIL